MIDRRKYQGDGSKAQLSIMYSNRIALLGVTLGGVHPEKLDIAHAQACSEAL